ncbi:hypothetical protein ACRRTK_024181 [Alexandromys fortis]
MSEIQFWFLFLSKDGEAWPLSSHFQALLRCADRCDTCQFSCQLDTVQPCLGSVSRLSVVWEFALIMSPDVSRAACGRQCHSLGWDPEPRNSGSNELSPGSPGLVLSLLLTVDVTSRFLFPTTLL